jgi:hypothetical protein
MGGFPTSHDFRPDVSLYAALSHLLFSENRLRRAAREVPVFVDSAAGEN